MINSDSISLDALPHYTDASRKVCTYINERRTEHRPVGADLLMDSHLSALCFFTRARSRSAALSFCKALFLSLLLAAVLVATVASSGSSGADEDASALRLCVPLALLCLLPLHILHMDCNSLLVPFIYSPSARLSSSIYC